MDVRRRLARNLTKLRHDIGWTQEDLADQAKLHRTHVSGLESGRRNPTIIIVERLAKALKVSASALLQ